MCKCKSVIVCRRRQCVYKSSLCVTIVALVFVNVKGVTVCIRHRCCAGKGGIVCKCKMRDSVYKSPLCVCGVFVVLL